MRKKRILPLIAVFVFLVLIFFNTIYYIVVRVKEVEKPFCNCENLFDEKIVDQNDLVPVDVGLRWNVAIFNDFKDEKSEKFISGKESKNANIDHLFFSGPRRFEIQFLLYRNW